MNIEEHTTRPSSAVDAPLIVAVASSADDLEAPSELVSALPTEWGAAFIVVQHLCPGRERLLAEALAKRTILPVMHAHDGLVAERGHIYMIPPNATLIMTCGRIRVTPVASGLTPRMFCSPPLRKSVAITRSA